jgi:hypothetical protein
LTTALRGFRTGSILAEAEILDFEFDPHMVIEPMLSADIAVVMASKSDHFQT